MEFSLNKHNMQTFLLTIVIFAFIVVSANGAINKGGLSESRPADDEVNQLVDRQRSQIIKKLCDSGKGNCPPSDEKITANNYKKQHVAGTNYFIAVTIGDNIWHIKIFSQPWTGTESVTNVQGPKQVTDEIKSF